ncbi:DinI-like family protein [Escherichia coli]|uniref:DinI-like family protein n=1 Tax=Escherichia coli TaxID=562 RepID=UPI000B7F31B0|nr:DinI-like family protein [Escherichia coli]
MRIEICIAKEKMTKMPNGAMYSLKEELTLRISKRYDDVELIVKATNNDGLSVTRTADKDSAKIFVQETLKDTWEPADEWFVH